MNSLSDRILRAGWLLVIFLLLVGCREQEGPVGAYAGPVPEGAAGRLGSGQITSLAFAPASGALIAGSKTGVTSYEAGHLQQAWQTATQTAVRDVAPSGDGRHLLAGLDDGTLLLLDGRDGALVESWPGYSGDIGVEAVAWSPDQAGNGSLAAAGFVDGHILLLRIAEEAVETIGELPRQESGISALAFNPDGRILATGNNGGELHLIDLESQRLLATFADHSNRIEDIAWSPDGAQLVTGDKDGVVIEWDLTRLSAAQIWPAEEEPIMAVDYLSEGGQVVMATQGGSLEQWTAGQTVDGIRATAGLPLLALAWDNDGGRVAAAGIDGLLHIGSLSEIEEWPGEAVQTLAGHAAKAQQALVVAYGPRDKALLSSSGNEVVIWDPQRAAPQMTFTLHEAPVSAAAWSPDGAFVASADRNGRIHIWNARDGKPLQTLDYHTRPVGGLAWSPDGTRLASSGSLADELVIWNVEEGDILHELHGEGDGLWAVAWSPDGTRLAAGSTAGKLFLWETADFAAQPDKFWRHQTWISDLEWFEDGRRLISGGGDNVVVLWDVLQRNSFQLSGHSAPVRGVAVSPDGALAVSAAINGEAIIWNTDPRAVEAIVTRLKGHTDGMTGADWSPAGDHIATASEDGTVLIWNVSAALGSSDGEQSQE